MCLNNCSEIKVAKKPIKVYKVLMRKQMYDKVHVFTSIGCQIVSEYRNFRYTRRKVYNEPQFETDGKVSGGIVNYGFHSFTTLTEAKRYVKSDPGMFYSGQPIIAEFEIPTNSLYRTGDNSPWHFRTVKFKNLTSNQIIYKRIIERCKKKK